MDWQQPGNVRDFGFSMSISQEYIPQDIYIANYALDNWDSGFMPFQWY